RARSSFEDHRRITALLERGGAAEEIERVVREHKLATVEAFRRWSLESGKVCDYRADGRGSPLSAESDREA
ncbi:MAG: GntR family transcriptional regulator, partial [Dehalococcoidia bacterium]|nr:GntR family transcriptional regulator [Dehalococcoidia bacterium]